MKIKKAVITAAGYGTRFFPLTKTIQKEMLPILNRPIIDYIVNDCLMAGVEEIIFIVKENDTQLQHFYSESLQVKAYLERMGKIDRYHELEKLHQKAKFSFVTQKSSEAYGTSIPLKLVKENVKDEDAFIMFMGDDYIYNSDGSSETVKMIKYFEDSGAQGLGTFIKRPKELLHKYGVARVRDENNFQFLIDIIEKPNEGEAPSDLVNISKYIFTPDIYDSLDAQIINPIQKEWLITDTLTIFAKDHDVVVFPTLGEYLDGGYLEGWLKANLLLASKDPQLLSSLKEYVNSL
ncbi:MAG TPA: sugar phosphate nucleotidyltransferase [Candidatus Dojkabacteria bacterium]|nr:sugar phosphate nucleotidyltransferase [Candidatus Dojkabacteria bacterium]HRO65595.1 sugar phosphate nucleotidyltransferase [Candidatus Dojkabacteria bacterium]HRP37379.1 sugar phosphate nucleotidyltransferase [Candidatus Dojkabacteria bacterium]HRP51716.1 sugar phosphate nucleotidyltransferase [Candidatus Dojkabacteria bacterium]